MHFPHVSKLCSSTASMAHSSKATDSKSCRNFYDITIKKYTRRYFPNTSLQKYCIDYREHVDMVLPTIDSIIMVINVKLKFCNTLEIVSCSWTILLNVFGWVVFLPGDLKERPHDADNLHCFRTCGRCTADEGVMLDAGLQKNHHSFHFHSPILRNFQPSLNFVFHEMSNIFLLLFCFFYIPRNENRFTIAWKNVSYQ